MSIKLFRVSSCAKDLTRWDRYPSDTHLTPSPLQKLPGTLWNTRFYGLTVFVRPTPKSFTALEFRDPDTDISAQRYCENVRDLGIIIRKMLTTGVAPLPIQIVLFPVWQAFCALKKRTKVGPATHGRDGVVVPSATQEIHSGDPLAGVSMGMPKSMPMGTIFNVLQSFAQKNFPTLFQFYKTHIFINSWICTCIHIAFNRNVYFVCNMLQEIR